MKLKEFGVQLGSLVQEFGLEVVYAPENFEKIEITKDDVNRPALQLAGYFDYFDPSRLQIIGKVETTYVGQFTPEQRLAAFEKLFSTGIPALIISRNIDIYPECLEAAQKHHIPIFRTNEFTSTIMSAIIASLKVSLAPMIQLHGVLVEIYGEGVLLLGDSGVGKSETAIELVKRGHRLVADDAVDIRRVSNQLIGKAPELIRHYIELRGIGVIDVQQLFGMSAVMLEAQIDLVIMLEKWREDKFYDRFGLDEEKVNILGLEVPIVTIPVQPGRNLATIVEVAAVNNRNKKYGFNAAKQLADELERHAMEG